MINLFTILNYTFFFIITITCSIITNNTYFNSELAPLIDALIIKIIIQDYCSQNMSHAKLEQILIRNKLFKYCIKNLLKCFLIYGLGLLSIKNITILIININKFKINIMIELLLYCYFISISFLISMMKQNNDDAKHNLLMIILLPLIIPMIMIYNISYTINDYIASTLIMTSISFAMITVNLLFIYVISKIKIELS